MRKKYVEKCSYKRGEAIAVWSMLVKVKNDMKMHPLLK
jgi:hypothetical protein